MRIIQPKLKRLIHTVILKTVYQRPEENVNGVFFFPALNVITQQANEHRLRQMNNCSGSIPGWGQRPHQLATGPHRIPTQGLVIAGEISAVAKQRYEERITSPVKRGLSDEPNAPTRSGDSDTIITGLSDIVYALREKTESAVGKRPLGSNCRQKSSLRTLIPVYPLRRKKSTVLFPSLPKMLTGIGLRLPATGKR